jgi:hypothetical protein
MILFDCEIRGDNCEMVVTSLELTDPSRENFLQALQETVTLMIVLRL